MSNKLCKTRRMHIEITDHAHVLHLGDEANMFDGDSVPALHAVLDEIEADDTAQCLVTVGDGKAYSTGFDVEFLGSAGDALVDFFMETFRVAARVLTFPLPTVAALNGHVFGMGSVFALAHDQRVMNAERGWFCFPEVDLDMRFHPFLQGVITAKLPPATVLEALLTGRRYDGPDAATAGIVDRAVVPADLVSAAIDVAADRRGKGRGIVRGLKTDLYADVLATLE